MVVPFRKNLMCMDGIEIEQKVENGSPYENVAVQFETFIRFAFSAQRIRRDGTPIFVEKKKKRWGWGRPATKNVTREAPKRLWVRRLP